MTTKLATLCDRIIEAGWLALVVAVPLYFNIYSSRTFEPDKITLFRSIVLVMALAWLISTLERGLSSANNGAPLRERLQAWSKIPLFLPASLLVLAYLISTLFGLSPSVSLWGSYQRMQGTYSMLSYIVVFALIASKLRSREQVDRLVTTIILTSIPVSLYGIVQKYGLDPLPWAGDVTSRVAANMGNAIFVASYLIMIIPLTLSRLIESMTAIIKEENASWGQTVLAAVYIFALAVQLITVLFSGSRGPMLGILGAVFVMSLLMLMILRRLTTDRTSLNGKEVGQGLVLMVLVGLVGGLGGGVGYLLGWGISSLFQALGYSFEGISLLGGALGGVFGIVGLYTYMAATGKGWRWLWVSWLGLAVLALLFIIALNVRGTPLDPVLNPIRQLPYVGRLANVIETEGTGKVRILIWDAAQILIMPHQPLGIPGDELAPPDRFNLIRPLVGYGPESMFNAFAFVYPIDLAYVEARGSSADRSHNETMDSLVTTGVLGFLAFYFLMVSLFYYALLWLGWLPTRAARRRLVVLLILGAGLGAIMPYLVSGKSTFMPLGLPLGLLVGLVAHLAWQGLRGLPAGPGENGQAEEVTFTAHPLLLVGILAAIIGHFIEVHFVFSIAATYTYFWTYAGLLVALARMKEAEPAAAPAQAGGETAVEAEEEVSPGRSKKRQARRAAARRNAMAGSVSTRLPHPVSLRSESWEIFIGSQGLALAIILIILVFDFVTPQFQFKLGDKNSLSLLWMYTITWLVGLAIALSDLAIRQETWRLRLDWPTGLRATMLYAVPSLGYFFIYYVAHRIQLGQRLNIASVEDVFKAAGVLTNGLVMFYVFLILLLFLLALMLAWKQWRPLPGWRSDNWWLYPPLVIVAALVVWFKNVNVVQADMYLKEGERYRSAGQWDYAIALHDWGRELDSDEDFYYLMLALDYQLMAQDGNLDAGRRQTAWSEGERIALTAREINPYNPDNTGNMGRYYFTMGQVADPARFQDALVYFDKATVLAPSNVVYHNLWAQTYYIMGNYQAAIDRLNISIAIDRKYPPSWILLGDTYAAIKDVDKALEAHSQSIRLSNDFFDGFVDQRMAFYNSAGRLDELIAVIQQAVELRPTDSLLIGGLGHAYYVKGDREQAITYLERARALGDTSDRILRGLGQLYLDLNAPDKATAIYESVLERNPNDVESHSALALIFAREGRVDDAIQHNQLVLQQLPNDYDSLKNLAILYQQKGDLQQALSMAQQAKAAAPEADAASWEKFIADLQSRLNGAGTGE